MSKSIKDVIKNEPVYDASAARQELENAINYRCNNGYCYIGGAMTSHDKILLKLLAQWLFWPLTKRRK